jgi:hypothetical protein
MLIISRAILSTRIPRSANSQTTPYLARVLRGRGYDALIVAFFAY